MGVPLDKLTRYIAWVFDDEAEFLHVAAGISNNFEIDDPFDNDFVAGAVGCLEPDRNVNLTDRYRYMKKIQFLTSRGNSVESYARNQDDELVWTGGSASLEDDDRADIIFSPDYPTLTDVPFPDWMYQGVSESADVVLAIRPFAGEQDWYQIFAPQDGNPILDSEGNPVLSPSLGVPFKTGTSTELLVKARRYTSGPICTDNNLGPVIEANLTGTIGEEETAHTIGISWTGLKPTFEDDEGSGSALIGGEWEAFGFAVIPEQNATSIDIILRRTD
jgi:hypothetical protein